MTLKCELGYLSRPDGSALLTAEKTVVLAAVYGPIEVRPQKLLINKATVEVTYRPRSGQPGISDRLFEETISNVFDVTLLAALHPRTCISIIVQEMQDNGGLLACAINASCLALISSGLSMKFLVAAVCCILDKNGDIILHPTPLQLQDSKAIFTFVFESINRKIVATETNGVFNTEQLIQCLEQCKTASSDIFKFYREIVKKYADKISFVPLIAQS